jgi:pimeloyl-ACP methyl ester carboxylesterase
MKRKHAPETAEAVTLEEVRAAVRWAPLPPRQLDYGAALLEVPRGRVATPGDVVNLAGGHGTLGELVACSRAVRGHELAYRVVKAGAAPTAAAAGRLRAEGCDVARLARVSLDPCRAERVIVGAPGGATTLVYLHGRNGFPSTYATRREVWWTRGALRALRVVLPGAGPRDGCRSAWLDYEDEGAAPTTGSLSAAREQVVAVVRRELQRGRSVVVGGYSEGCLVGLEAALRTPGVLGFVGVNGMAPPPSDEHVATTFPVLFVNGADDATIDHAAAARSLAALDRPDASAVAVAGAGHGLADDEGRLLDWGLRRLGLGCISVS